MSVRWFVSPLIETLVQENGEWINRKYPKVCLPVAIKDTATGNTFTRAKYPCKEWSGQEIAQDLMLIRMEFFEGTEGMIIDPSDVIKELGADEDWREFYQEHQGLRYGWHDQPRG